MCGRGREGSAEIKAEVVISALLCETYKFENFIVDVFITSVILHLFVPVSTSFCICLVQGLPRALEFVQALEKCKKTATVKLVDWLFSHPGVDPADEIPLMSEPQTATVEIGHQPVKHRVLDFNCEPVDTNVTHTVIRTWTLLL